MEALFSTFAVKFPRSNHFYSRARGQVQVGMKNPK